MKLKKFIPVLFYIIITALIFFYGNTFIKILNPEYISLEYKLYFVDKKLATWPVYDGIGYELGQILNSNNYEMKKRRGTGTFVNETEEVCINNENSYFYFSCIPQEDLIFKVKFLKTNETYFMKVYANDSKIGEFTTEINDESEYEFIISKDIIDKNGYLCIEFYTKTLQGSNIIIDSMSINEFTKG